MLYDMTGQMATRLRTLLRCFWRRIIAPSRDMRLMADVSSSVGEDMMLWSGCTWLHRALTGSALRVLPWRHTPKNPAHPTTLSGRAQAQP